MTMISFLVFQNCFQFVARIENANITAVIFKTTPESPPHVRMRKSNASHARASGALRPGTHRRAKPSMLQSSSIARTAARHDGFPASLVTRKHGAVTPSLVPHPSHKPYLWHKALRHRTIYEAIYGGTSVGVPPRSVCYSAVVLSRS